MENDGNRSQNEPATAAKRGMLIPLSVAAFVLIVAAIIFSSAGPDRTRTAEFNNPNSNQTSIEKSKPAESSIPVSDAARNEQAAPAAPQRTDPNRQTVTWSLEQMAIMEKKALILRARAELAKLDALYAEDEERRTVLENRARADEALALELENSLGGWRT